MTKFHAVSQNINHKEEQVFARLLQQWKTVM